MNSNNKIVLIFILIGLTYLVFDEYSIHSNQYNQLYNKTPKKDSIAKSCSLLVDNIQIIASDCIKVSKSQWHIRPCGSLNWCSINVSNREIKLSRKKFCSNETSVFYSKKLLKKYLEIKDQYKIQKCD